MSLLLGITSILRDRTFGGMTRVAEHLHLLSRGRVAEEKRDPFENRFLLG